MLTPSLVVHDFNVSRPNLRPHEADAPLIVDADTVLTFPIVLQRFQVIARWRLQESQRLCCVQLREQRPATLASALSRRGLFPSYSAKVSLHLNDWIMRVAYYAPRNIATGGIVRPLNGFGHPAAGWSVTYCKVPHPAVPFLVD